MSRKEQSAQSRREVCVQSESQVFLTCLGTTVLFAFHEPSFSVYGGEAEAVGGASNWPPGLGAARIRIKEGISELPMASTAQHGCGWEVSTQPWTGDSSRRQLTTGAIPQALIKPRGTHLPFRGS